MPSSSRSSLGRNYVILVVGSGLLTWGDAARGAVMAGGYWLPEGERDRCAEQLEGAGLDGGGIGEFLAPPPAETDDLPAKGGKMAEQVFVPVNRQPAGSLPAGALSAVIQSIPGSSRRSAIRVLVIIPRSPTIIISPIPKSSRTSTSSSASLEADDRPSRTSQPQSRTKMR